MSTRPETRPRLPTGVLVLAVIATIAFVLPLVGLAWRVPWSRFLEILGDADSRDALWLSLRSSSAAAAASLVLGVPLAVVLARVAFPGRALVRALTTLSMVLPPVVGGVALLFSLGRHGLVGQYLDRWFGLGLPFSSWGVVVAQTFVAMPFVVVAVESALRQLDPQIEDAARTLGATPATVFWRVTLPSIRPAVIAGAVLAWARALGEFGATITFAGSFPGRTQTVPLRVYAALDSDPGAALALSMTLVGVSFAVLLTLRDHWFGGLRTERDR